jgi:hypothetical protein
MDTGLSSTVDDTCKMAQLNERVQLTKSEVFTAFMLRIKSSRSHRRNLLGLLDPRRSFTELTLPFHGIPTGREADYSYPSNAEVKNEWGCTPNHQYAFTACTGILLLYLSALYK